MQLIPTYCRLCHAIIITLRPSALGTLGTRDMILFSCLLIYSTTLLSPILSNVQWLPCYMPYLALQAVPSIIVSVVTSARKSLGDFLIQCICSIIILIEQVVEPAENGTCMHHFLLQPTVLDALIFQLFLCTKESMSSLNSIIPLSSD